MRLSFESHFKESSWNRQQVTHPSNQPQFVPAARLLKVSAQWKNGLYTVGVSCKEKKIFTISFVGAAAAQNWSGDETKPNIKINQRNAASVCARGMWIERQVQWFWGGLFWVNGRKEGWIDGGKKQRHWWCWVLCSVISWALTPSPLNPP